MLRALALLLLVASPLRADETADRAAALQTAFAGWMDQVGARRGVLALRRDDAPAGTWARGAGADDPLPLASLSKLVTALCIDSLVRDGALSYATPARDVLAMPEGQPGTIGQVVTHATGLYHDRTQGPMTWWRHDPTPRWPEIARQALDASRIAPGTPEFYYSNENYALLGAVIEARTGQGYEDACRARVLDPAGVTAQPSDIFAAYLPWGGWDMSMPGFARLMDHAFAPGGVLAGRAAELPAMTIEGPVAYGMAMYQRDMGEGMNRWHFGSLCFDDGPNLGGYAVRWRNGWTAAAWYDACLTEKGMLALDAALARAAHGG